MAAYLAGLPEPEGPKEPWSPRVADWDLPAQQAAQIIDLLKRLCSTVVAVNNKGKAPSEDPHPLPKTLLDQERGKKRREDDVAFVSMFGFGPDDI